MYSGTTNEFCLLLFVFSCAVSAYSKGWKNIKKWRINEPITYSESASLWWKYFDAEKVRYTEVLVSSEISEVLFVKLTIQSFTEVIIFLTGSCWCWRRSWICWIYWPNGTLYHFFSFWKSTGGSAGVAVGANELQSGGLEFTPRSNRWLDLCMFLEVPSSSPSIALVNSQLVCLRPVGILNLVMFILIICFCPHLWAIMKTTGLPVIMFVLPP